MSKDLYIDEIYLFMKIVINYTSKNYINKKFIKYL